MVLLQAGYWQTTYFPSNYWQTNQQYWSEYGTGVVSSGGSETLQIRRATRRKPRRRNLKVFKVMKEYLEFKVNDADN